MDKIIIDLPNGDQMVAEKCEHAGGQIAIGIMHDGCWVQDLTVVETAIDEHSKYAEDKFNVYVFGNEYNEDYTECFEIDRTLSNAL